METTINSNTPAMSEDIRELAKQFLLAKKQFLATGFGGTNAHQKYNYAKIGDIYHAVEGALGSHDIIIWHFSRPVDGIEYLHTRLIHTLTGQFVEDCRIVESEKPGNQGKGAANTYMKKYALLSLCSIAAEDDDGQGEQEYISTNNDYISEAQLKQLQTTIKSCSNASLIYGNILKFNKINDLADLKSVAFESVKSYIANSRE